MNFRAASDQDGHQIAVVAESNDLLLADLTPAIFERMLRWLYVESPAGVRVQFVALQDDAIIAHYGALPLAYKVGSERWLGAFGSNLVIAREHRAGMTFFSIQGHFQKAWRASGMQFAYGLVTRASVVEPHLRAGWRLLGDIPVYAKPIDFPAVAHTVIPKAARFLAYLPLVLAQGAMRLFDALRGAHRRGDVTIERVSDFSSVPPEFLDSLMASHEFAAVRDRETLAWRFTQNPDREYMIDVARRGTRTVGYIVTRILQMKHLRTLAIVDFGIESGDSVAADALLMRCASEARASSAAVVATILNPSSTSLPSFERNGFLRTPESFTLIFQALRSSREASILADAYGRWHITWFDHDYV